MLSAPSPGVGFGLGTGLAGMLGQLAGGGVGGLPMRALEALGLVGKAPTGSELLGHLGMDQESPLTSLLGMALEMGTDPLTYLGGALGRTGAEAAAASAARAAAADARLGNMAGTGLTNAVRGEALRDASSMGTNAAAEMYRATGQHMPIQPFLDDIAPLRNVVNPEMLASGNSRVFRNVEPGLARRLDDAGLGVANAADNTVSLGAALKSRVGQAGRQTGPSQAVPAPFMTAQSGNRQYNLQANSLPPDMPTRSEMDLLRDVSKSFSPEDIASIHPLGGSPFSGAGASQLGPQGELISLMGGGNVPGATIDPMRAIATSRYRDAQDLANILAQQQGGAVAASHEMNSMGDIARYLDRGAYSGPFSTPVSGASSGLADYLAPLLGAGAVGGGAGAAWGLGGGPPFGKGRQR